MKYRTLEEKQTLAVYLPTSLIERLKELARAEQRTVSGQITHLLMPVLGAGEDQ